MLCSTCHSHCKHVLYLLQPGGLNRRSFGKRKFPKSVYGGIQDDGPIKEEVWYSPHLTQTKDKNTWFKEPPFEERMQTACEQGTLVLLRNLDPTYISTEVEDIIQQGLKEKCSAKMLPQTTTSSPHSGQAFVIFKTKEAAKTAIKKLETGCLVLPDGRPLVGCVETPCSPGKQSTFTGHLVISNPKQPQTRGTKEAVSTSHCSQPNTIVYDMAMEWCLLQQKSDFVLDKLYKLQGVELKKVKALLKSK